MAAPVALGQHTGLDELPAVRPSCPLTSRSSRRAGRRAAVIPSALRAAARLNSVR